MVPCTFQSIIDLVSIKLSDGRLLSGILYLLKTASHFICIKVTDINLINI